MGRDESKPWRPELNGRGPSWALIPGMARGVVGPASAAGLTLTARPPHAGPSGQAHVGSAPEVHGSC
jgi:hypothetical protein